MIASPNISRRLILMRHGKSDWSTGLPDHERPLAERGRRDAPLMGAYLATHRLVPDLALVSTACRAQQSWLAAARAFAHPPAVIDTGEIYEAGAEVLLEVIRRTDPAIGMLMIVGHNPGLQELALRLIGPAGGCEAAVRLREKFPTAAIAVLAFDTPDWQETGDRSAVLERFVTPKSLLR